MIFWLLFGFLFAFSIFTTYFLIRFARIIMILEDDFSEAISTLQDAENSIDEVLKMPLFYDSPEVKAVVTNVFNDIKITKLAITSLMIKFTQRSKQRYIQVKEYTEEN